MIKLLRYLFRKTRHQQLPRLSHTLKDSLDPIQLDSDIELILMTGRVRDIHEAKKLMEKYGAKNGAELLAKLPPPPPVDWRKRLRAWVRGIEGAYETDPHKDDWKITRDQQYKL